MSFDEYVHHISQKYRLAVAISVIKTKPNNVSVEEYLSKLQKKIKDSEFDPNKIVCSDDFNFDDDDVSYDKNQQNTSAGKSNNETQPDYSVNDYESQCSQTILNDFVFDDARLVHDVGRESTIEDIIRSLKEVETVQDKSDSIQNSSQLTFCESQEATTSKDIRNCNNNNNNSCIQKENVNNYHIDSQETVLYPLHGFTQNDTHVSQTQGDYFVLSDKYIRSNAVGNIQDTAKCIKAQNGNNIQASQNLLTQNDFASTVSDRNVIESNAAPRAVNVVNADSQNAQSFQFVGKNVKAIYVHDNNINDNNDTRVTELESRNVSNVEKGKLDYTQTLEFNIQKAVRNEFTFYGPANITKSNDDISKGIAGINTTENNIKDVYSTDFGNNTPLLLNNSQKTELHEKSRITNNTENANDITCKNKENFTNEPSRNINDEQLLKETNNNDNNNEKMDVDDTESDDNIQERVPFKVLEELNRVKSYLNRKDRDRRNNDGYSTDSGYRSDSQSRSSLKSASQVCGAWLNQSAYCLFNYLVQTVGTDDIDKEIAQALGQLIDRLHEDENYPQFLEEMLETVDGLLDDIRQGGVHAENVLINKDENMQRLILLNKSKQILKHSIEKITSILENLHINLTQENLYELTNIAEIENSSYIFHILEIFLKRYVKIKDVSSESTRNSQEDTFPKRSSLTELWRKKWNPQCKEIVKNENTTCVLKKCKEILNKIIVECMDGYSLVAFAALQCFNLIQI